MGFAAQVQQPQTSQPSGKGAVSQVSQIAEPTSTVNSGAPNFQPQGKGSSTNSATSGQPRMGQPNNYANTVGGWDNASIQPQRSGGKGKGY
jgi:hypothetical protein